MNQYHFGVTRTLDPRLAKEHHENPSRSASSLEFAQKPPILEPLSPNNENESIPSSTLTYSVVDNEAARDRARAPPFPANQAACCTSAMVHRLLKSRCNNLEIINLTGSESRTRYGFGGRIKHSQA
jgi:hypothetical protein